MMEGFDQLEGRKRGTRIGRLLMAAARGRAVGWFVRTAFSSFSGALPLDRLHETDTLVAFRHPSPSYPVHILIVPKRNYASLLEVPSGDLDFMHDLFQTIQTLVMELELDQTSYRLVVNGGDAQEVGMLHFHLIGE